MLRGTAEMSLCGFSFGCINEKQTSAKYMLASAIGDLGLNGTTKTVRVSTQDVLLISQR